MAELLIYYSTETLRASFNILDQNAPVFQIKFPEYRAEISRTSFPNRRIVRLVPKSSLNDRRPRSQIPTSVTSNRETAKHENLREVEQSVRTVLLPNRWHCAILNGSTTRPSESRPPFCRQGNAVLPLRVKAEEDLWTKQARMCFWVFGRERQSNLLTRTCVKKLL